ncbi:hypothetical protein [Streptomyces ardesiacus]|uniref:hypothetical protein n=1 Tax=Streptomyces ardesiacus TaxID=285564 RepID=UPI0036E16F2A
MEPGVDLHPGQECVAGEGGQVGAGGEVGAQQVVLAVPVRAVREAPVGGEGGEGVDAGGIEGVLGGEVALFGEPGADGAARWPWCVDGGDVDAFGDQAGVREDRAVGGREAGEGVGALGGGVLAVGEEQLRG